MFKRKKPYKSLGVKISNPVLPATPTKGTVGKSHKGNFEFAPEKGTSQ